MGVTDTKPEYRARFYFLIFIIIIFMDKCSEKLALKSFPYLNIYQKFGNVHIFICNCHSDYNISIVRFICKQENLSPPKNQIYMHNRK